MTRSAFQSGISWDVIFAKWDGFREVFKNFDVQHIAGLDEPDIDELMKDKRIIRNRPKIAATIHNARTLIDLDREHKGFKRYLRSFDSYEALVKDMRKRFKFLGETGCYIFLYVVKEKVPEYHEWRARQAHR